MKHMIAPFYCGFILCTLLVIPSDFNAQDPSALNINIKELSIMPIPYTTNGLSEEEVYQKEVEYRIALAKIRQAFANAGFRVLDFEAIDRKNKYDIFFRNLDNEQDSIKKLIARADPDIYLEVELIHDQHAIEGDKVQLRMQAYFTTTSTIIASIFEETNRFYQADIGALTIRAMRDCLDPFLKDMQAGLERILREGQPFQVDIEIAQNSTLDLQSLLMDTCQFKDVLPLKDFISLWLKHHSLRFHTKGESDHLIVFDVVRLPIFKDASRQYYDPVDFQRHFWKFLRSLKRPGNSFRLKVDKDRIGNTFYYTISD